MSEKAVARAAPSLLLGLVDLSGRMAGAADGLPPARRLLDLTTELLCRRYGRPDRPAVDLGGMLLGYRTGAGGREAFRPLLPGTREPGRDWLTVDDVMAPLRG